MDAPFLFYLDKNSKVKRDSTVFLEGRIKIVAKKFVGVRIISYLCTRI